MSLTADDKAEILDLSAHCNHSFDAGDFDDWVQCFTVDAVYDAPALGRRLEGHERLREFASTLGRPVPIRTMSTTHAIDEDGDCAKMVSFYSVLLLNDPPQTTAVGRYEDRLAMEKGAWKLARRRIAVYWNNENQGWA